MELTWAPISLQLRGPVRFGSAKVRIFFYLSSFGRKNFKYFSSNFSSFLLPVEAGCKGTAALFGFARGLKNKFSLPSLADPDDRQFYQSGSSNPFDDFAGDVDFYGDP